MSLDIGQLVLALLEGLTSGSIIALTALGLSLVFGVMRIVNVAHGEFYMIGAVTAWYVSTATGSFAAALLVAPLVAGGIALAAERLVLRSLEYKPEATIVATIGMLYIIQQAVLSIYGPEARAVVPPVAFTIEFPWFGYSGYRLVVVGLAALLLFATWLLIENDAGLYMRRSGIVRSRVFSVPIHRINASFAPAILAAVAGVLIVPVQQAHCLMGLDALLLSFMVVIIGGLGSLRGTIAAAFLIGLIDGLVSVFFSPPLARIVAALLVALVLVFRTGGLLGEQTA
jgi:branched-chain amino acid transport system permease protein